MISIIDYGAGNLKSVMKLVEYLQYPVQISGEAGTLAKSDLLILPGVGAFEEGMRALNASGTVPLIRDWVAAEKPFMAICLGFQMLFESSTENGHCAGLGLFPGHVVKFDPSVGKVPHMGWNTLTLTNDPNTMFSGLGDSPYVYFVHSYFVPETDPEIVSARAAYGTSFVAAIQKKNLFAAQFHPEKSGQVGMTMLANFIRNVT